MGDPALVEEVARAIEEAGASIVVRKLPCDSGDHSYIIELDRGGQLVFGTREDAATCRDQMIRAARAKAALSVVRKAPTPEMVEAVEAWQQARLRVVELSCLPIGNAPYRDALNKLSEAEDRLSKVSASPLYRRG